MLLFTIAFNNSKVIKLQHSKLFQYLKEPFVYFVIDNSSLKSISNEINKYCVKHEIAYLKLPPNPFLNKPSKSHGAAINYAYNNIVIKINPVHFGFLDHDIFPFRETVVSPLVKYGFYGLVQERREKWYLWPGFSFYKFQDIKKYKLDFMPCTGLDTGGANYDKIYKFFKKDNISEIDHIYYDLENKKKIDHYPNTNNVVELIGDWLHLMKASNWDNKKGDKDSIILEFLKDSDAMSSF